MRGEGRAHVTILDLPATEGTLLRRPWRRSSPLSGRGIRRTCAHNDLVHAQDHAHVMPPPQALPSRHAAHHELRGDRVLLGNGARVVPEHAAPPLVPPSVLCQVDHLVDLIVALGVLLTGCGQENTNVTAVLNRPQTVSKSELQSLKK